MQFDITNASVQYHGIPVLRDVTLSFNGVSALILTGPTGSGKTTLLRLLYAALQPNTGQVLIDGADTKRMRSSAIQGIRRRMGIVEQECRLVSAYNVFDNVLMPLALSGMKKSEATARCLSLLADMNISYLRNKMPRELSGGERHLVALARSIAMEPEVLIADEPTGTLDDGTSSRLAATLSACLDRGMGLIISTHSASLVASFPTARLCTLNEGVLSESATITSALPEEKPA